MSTTLFTHGTSARKTGALTYFGHVGAHGPVSVHRAPALPT